MVEVIEESENSHQHFNRAVKYVKKNQWMKTSWLSSKSPFPPICEKPMKAFWSVRLPNQSNHHQTEIPSEPEKSHSFDSFPSFRSEPRPLRCLQYIIGALEWAQKHQIKHTAFLSIDQCKHDFIDSRRWCK